MIRFRRFCGALFSKCFLILLAKFLVSSEFGPVLVAALALGYAKLVVYALAVSIAAPAPASARYEPLQNGPFDAEARFVGASAAARTAIEPRFAYGRRSAVALGHGGVAARALPPTSPIPTLR